MSLRYVTRKLECQSLTEKEDGGEGQKVQAEELPIFSQVRKLERKKQEQLKL